MIGVTAIWPVCAGMIGVMGKGVESSKLKVEKFRKGERDALGGIENPTPGFLAKSA
jgi:hypothetical protein